MICHIVRYTFAIERNKVLLCNFLYLQETNSQLWSYVKSQFFLFFFRWKWSSIVLISWFSMDFTKGTLNKSQGTQGLKSDLLTSFFWPWHFISLSTICDFIDIWGFLLPSQNHLWCICGRWCFAHASVSSAWLHVDEPCCLILKFARTLQSHFFFLHNSVLCSSDVGH